MANEYDLGNSAATVAFYRKKIKPLLAWAEREGKGELNAQTLREFFRYLKTKSLTDNGRHASYRAIRTWLNFLVRRKIIRDYEGRVPRERGRYPLVPFVLARLGRWSAGGSTSCGSGETSCTEEWRYLTISSARVAYCWSVLAAMMKSLRCRPLILCVHQVTVTLPHSVSNAG